MKAAAPIGAAVLVLSLGGTCLAHALSPTHYPLGPFPFLMIRDSAGWFVLVILIAILASTALLRWRVPELGFLGNLWRSTIVYVLSRVAEFGLMAVAPTNWPLHGFGGCQLKDTVPQVAVLLIASSGVAFGLMWLLYGKEGWRKRLALAFATTLLGYAAAFPLGMFIMGVLW